MKQYIAGWENIKSLFSSGIWEGRGKWPHWKTSAVDKNVPDGLIVWGLTPRCPRGLYVYVCVQPCVCMCSFSIVIRECVYAPGFKLQLITSSLTHTHTQCLRQDHYAVLHGRDYFAPRYPGWDTECTYQMWFYKVLNLQFWEASTPTFRGGLQKGPL